MLLSIGSFYAPNLEFVTVLQQARFDFEAVKAWSLVYASRGSLWPEPESGQRGISADGL